MKRELNFITKKNIRNTDFDVTINTLKERIIMVFRDGTDKKITSTEHLVFAVADNRIYFKEETSRNGYKTSTQGTKFYKVVTLPRKGLENVSAFDGSYNIKFDGELGLYYIEK